jgi:hypothetical protein
MKIRFNSTPRSSGVFRFTCKSKRRYVFEPVNDMTADVVDAGDAAEIMSLAGGYFDEVFEAENADASANSDDAADGFTLMSRDDLVSYAMAAHGHKFHHNTGIEKMRSELRLMDAVSDAALQAQIDSADAAAEA